MGARDIFYMLVIIGILTAAIAITGPGNHQKFSSEDCFYELKQTCTDDGDCIEERVPCIETLKMEEVFIEDGEVCFRTGYQDAECFDFSNVYHEGILPLTINGVNNDFKTLFVTVDSYFTSGSDGACESFGYLINNLLESMPEGWQIYVMNAWVPSKENPIDLGWSRELAKGY